MDIKEFCKEEKGMIIVEATIVFPIIIVITLLLYFLSLYLFQIFYLQSACDIALTSTYHTLSDDNILVSNNEVIFVEEYAVNPYDVLFVSGNERNEIDTIIKDKILNHMIFNNSLPDNGFEIETKVTNWIVYTDITVVVNGSIPIMPVLQIFGIDKVNYEYSATKYIDNHDEFVRNVDCAFYLGNLIDEKYGISEKLSPFFTVVKDVYNKFLEW